MRRNIKKTLLSGLIVGFCLIGIFGLSEKVGAVSCSDISEYGWGSSNPYYLNANAVWYACKTYFYSEPDTPRGSLWLSDAGSNGSFEGSPTSTNVDSRITINIDDLNSGYKDISLQGAWFGSTTDRAAEDIGIFKYDATIWYDPDDYDVSEYEPIEDVPSSMMRYGQVSMWDNDIVSYITTLKLNVRKFMQGEQNNNNCKLDGATTNCGIRLEIFRCPSGASVGSTNCYSDAAFLNVEIQNQFAGEVLAIEPKDHNTNYSSNFDNWYKQNKLWTINTNWSDGNDFQSEVSHVIDNCNPSGCYAQFAHRLWSKAMYAADSYKIKRETFYNDGTSSTDYLSGSASEYAKLNFGEANFKFVKMDSVTLRPGGKICETLEFYTDGKGTKTAKACVSAKGYLSGETRAMGTTDTSASWDNWKNSGNWWIATNNDNWTSVAAAPAEVSHDIVECNSDDGCPVQFRHYLKKGQDSSAFYKIERSANVDQACDGNSDFCNGVIVESEKSFSSSGGTGVRSDAMTIYPGQTICETLWFKEKSTDDYNTYTKACVTALGTSTSSIDIKVRNDNLNGVNEYGQYHESTYAKPGDSISYLVEYTPTLQYTYNTIPNKLKVDGGNVINNNNNKTLGELFNDNKGSLADWNNAFRITGDLFDQDSYQTPGDSSKVSIDNLSATAGTIAGQQYTERAETNPRDKNDNSIIHSELWTTPSQIEITKSSNEILMDVSTGQLSDEATAYVPYNFENTTSVGVSSNGDGKILYAGEKENITFDITVGQRYNRTLEGTYATRVEGAKWKIQICYDGGMSCDSSQEIQGTLNDNDSLSGITKSKTIEGMPIRDVPAGTKVKVKTMVYPIQSYNDLETDSNKWRVYCNSAYDHCWSSAEADFTIAKKPSFQVWGGSLYSAGNIFAPSATKTSLAGFNISGSRTFGSWSELSLAVGGDNKDMGSGASLGNNPDADPQIGNTSAEYCAHSTLTLANTRCNNPIGVLSASSIALPTTGDFIATLESEGYIRPDNPDSILDGEDFNPSPEDPPLKHLYSFGGDILISGDIKINRGAEYNDFSHTPSIIIYTTGRINIQCGVTRIDAILIAGGTINTCSDEDADSLKKDSIGSLQLTINGALSANRIDFNRTYGAATGENSIVPAEIINYDSSLVLDYSSGTTESTPITLDDLTVQYIHELAPRY